MADSWADTSVTNNIFWFCPSDRFPSSNHFETTIHFFVAFSLSILLRISWHMLCQLSFPLFLLASPPIPRPNTHTGIISWFRTIHGSSDLPWTICMTLGTLLLYCKLSTVNLHMILFGVEKEMLGMTTLKIRAVLAWIWLQLWTRTTVLIWETCGSNLLQGFILSSAGLSGQAHMSCRSMFFSSDGADLPLCTAAACARAPHFSGLLDWLIYPPLSNLANDFSLQILLVSLETRHTASSHVNHIPKLWCHLYFPLSRLLRNPAQDDYFHLISSLGKTRAGLLGWTL